MENRQEFATRLRRAVQHTNDHYDVAGLCREFPERIDKLKDGCGEKPDK